MVLSPEHEMVKELTTLAQKDAVESYVEQAAKKSDLERTDLNKNKTGVFTGSYGIDPVNGAKVPIWISDYVLMGHGTGAIMAVPAHDERDWDFAKKFGLPILKVVASKEEVARLGDGDEEKGAAMIREASKNPEDYKKLAAAHPDIFDIASECTPAKDGYAINSEHFSGVPTKDVIAQIISWLSQKASEKPPSATSSATGFSAASDIGASRFLSSTAKNAALFLSRKKSFRLNCRT